MTHHRTVAIPSRRNVAVRLTIRSTSTSRGCDDATAPRPHRPVRPPERTRLVWRVVRGQPERHSLQRARAHGTQGPDEHGASRRHGRRARHRRRCRHPDAGPRPVPARGRRLRPARGRCVRGGCGIPPGGRRGVREGNGRHRSHRCRCRAVDTRLARCAGESRLSRRNGACGHADVQAALRERPGRRHGHRTRPQGLRCPQAQPPRTRRRPGDLLRVTVGSHHRLQGDVHDAAAECVLSPTCSTLVSSRRC